MSRTCTTKGSMNLRSVILFAACVLLVTGNAVFAVPFLQLDADPSAYDVGDESIVTTETQFTLYTLVNSNYSQFDTGETFYLSVAVVPTLLETDPPPTLGYFVFDDGIMSQTIAVTGDMEYGNPPVDIAAKNNDLPGHGVYDTYYWEYSFTLDDNKRADLYNSQEDFGGPESFDGDRSLYYQDFEVDVSGLISGNFLHFDLYTCTTNDKGELVVADMAPFSHDVLTTPVPGAVLLGMLGLGVAGVKLRRFA